MSYTHFTLEERKYLQKLLSDGLSMRRIAEILERSPSSISREIKRNRSQKRSDRKHDNRYCYNHWRAQNLYVRRRREGKRQKLKSGSEEWEYIVDNLQQYWSPETICGRWHVKHPARKPLCISTIYRYIALKKFPNITRKKNLRRHGKRRQTKNANYNAIQPDRIIPQWPEEIRNRTRIGDWEGDTVFGGTGKGFIVTLVDRKSRYVRIGLLKTHEAQDTRQVTEKLLAGLPVKSISFDNGPEFAEFHLLEENLDTLVYFAEPHSPWQRGTNENTNDIIRFFFPKGCDFRKVTDEDIQHVEDLLNNRPRKCLGWKTPSEVFHESVALD